MARRKRQMMDDDDSSDASGSDGGGFDDPTDPTEREERAMFDDPYGRKRRKTNGKEDALYGVFADDSDDDERAKKAPGKSRAQTAKSRAKAPVFVSGDSKAKVELDAAMAVDGDGEASSDEDGDADEDEDDEPDESGDEDEEMDDSTRAPSPRVQAEEEPPQRARFGGIGSGGNAQSNAGFSGLSKGGIGSGSQASSGFTKGGIGSKPREADLDAPAGSSKGGIGSKSQAAGFTKGGIGASASVPAFSASSSASTPARAPSPLPASASVPSAFGGARAQAQRSFVRPSEPPSGASTPLPAHERAHFSKLTGFGAKMLEKMGWQAGQGLGTTGEGIVIPVESKLRPKGMGIAFNNFREKTEQSKMEARRRGEVVSDDEEDKPKRGKRGAKGAEKEAKKGDAWKKPKRVKTKIEHKTYEQIVAEAGIEPSTSSGIGQIFDATSGTLREVSSLADISSSSWTPSTDPTRIPEVRHNLRLIAESCKSDLDGLAREGKALEERKRWVANEDLRLRKKIEQEAELISRLQQISLDVEQINAQAKEMASIYEVSLDPFSPLFSKLLVEFPNEFDRYRLDEIVVAAITPSVRRMVAQWNPLEEPTAFISTFRNWRQALKLGDAEEKPQGQVDVYGTRTYISPASQVEKSMTPFESLLWNVWLPRLRTSLNNDWAPQDPTPAVKLYEAWSTFLPPFIRDNVLDQLILPKVHKAVTDWSARKDTVSLRALVFPWLPHLGLRLEEVLGDAKRKVKSLLRAWTTDEEVPKDLKAWKEMFDASDWDAMLLKYVVPKLGALLRDEFRVDPRNQDMGPLLATLAWEPLIRPSILAQILTTEFFPKWLGTLHLWLVQPRVSFEEVAQWYQFWRDAFPDTVRALPGVGAGFTRGLQLMNTAIELGPEAPTRLPRPDTAGLMDEGTAGRTTAQKARPVPARAQEVTFRAVVEDFAASHNLLFIPIGRVHEGSRMPLFRVSQTADGKGGLLVYILDDTLWAADGEEYKPITPQDMVVKASK
ncbi:hypothetical protein HWV62_22381 [Athelia sp. TMB]|nr:hypothetical protein HWV62_22381 [Athelia sp. TMB]